ncbi:hypothetical protein BKA58DRAFT_199386 [Alternaria rosae]|uniref:uncharacterized protein n=1 Tax=Alternaria rosae TaxID=1187941 RepID=UPI001E8D30B9|nr:uncharacterized protein BKA58DRAFT_199386 [Alternaria rosae]KAH6868701.1 hypothetical protein BKA58DRAFT_199386 [Alternaria rosae]
MKTAWFQTFMQRATPYAAFAARCWWSCATRMVVVGQEPRESNMKNTNRRPVKLRIRLRLAANAHFAAVTDREYFLVADIRCPALRCVCVVPLAIILRRRTLSVERPCRPPPWVTYDCGRGRMVDRHKHIRLCVPLVPFLVIQTLFLSYNGFIRFLTDIHYNHRS